MWGRLSTFHTKYVAVMQLTQRLHTASFQMAADLGGNPVAIPFESCTCNKQYMMGWTTCFQFACGIIKSTCCSAENIWWGQQNRVEASLKRGEPVNGYKMLN